MTPFEFILIFSAAVLAGGINAIAGGGTFFAFPALLSTGISPVAANATCTIAVWPGSLASVWGYRSQLKNPPPTLRLMIAVALVGGLAGALLLLVIPETAFERMIPWLLLGATLLFACGRRFSDLMARLGAGHPRYGPFRQVLALLLQLAIAVYGGFFGAGIGILTLAMLQLLGMQEMHRMNGIKTVIAAAINATAVVTFVLAGVISWPHAWVMVAGGILGGYFGAKLSLRLPAVLVKRFVIAVGFAMSLLFFMK